MDRKRLPILVLLLVAVKILEAQDSTCLRMIFMGDLMQHRAQLESAKQASGYRYDSCFARLAPRLHEADLTVLNMETTFYGEPYTGYPRFNSPPALARAAAEAGADVFLAANNHILDTGAEGLAATEALYDSLPVFYCGFYRDSADRAEKYPLIIETKGIRIALLNYTYGTNGMPDPGTWLINRLDTVQIRKDIEKALLQEPDCIICCPHWGREYELQPDAAQKEWEAWMYRQGIDIIMGSHPHVPQPVRALVDAKGEIRHLTAYSLGNMLSNMQTPHTRIGLLCGFTLVKAGGRTRITAPYYEWLWTWHKNDNEYFIVLPLSDKRCETLDPKAAATLGRMRLFMQEQSPDIAEHVYE